MVDSSSILPSAMSVLIISGNESWGADWDMDDLFCWRRLNNSHAARPIITELCEGRDGLFFVHPERLVDDCAAAGAGDGHCPSPKSGLGAVWLGGAGLCAVAGFAYSLQFLAGRAGDYPGRSG